MKNILTIGLTKYLTGEPLANLLSQNWSNATESTRSHFNYSGFEVDPTDTPAMLEDLRQELHSQKWDGVLVAWCSRGYPQRTELFEQIMAVCTEEVRVQKEMKLIFNTGPQDLVEPVLRNFPEERV